jgi:hypothetical protein
VSVRVCVGSYGFTAADPASRCYDSHLAAKNDGSSRHEAIIAATRLLVRAAVVSTGVVALADTSRG